MVSICAAAHFLWFQKNVLLQKCAANFKSHVTSSVDKMADRLRRDAIRCRNYHPVYLRKTPYFVYIKVIMCRYGTGNAG